MNVSSVKANPYDWINPVVQPGLFAGRRHELGIVEEEVARLADTKPIAPTVAVVGERRVGKTSLLRRVEKICEEYRVLAVPISVTGQIAADPWYFWQEVFSRLVFYASESGILLETEAKKHFGFTIPNKEGTANIDQPTIGELWFATAHALRLKSVGSPGLTSHILEHDFRAITDALLRVGYRGVLLMLDEAHALINAQEIKEQLRNTVRGSGKTGILFSGESRLSSMFANDSEPFFNQARVVTLKNFTDPRDVAECSLLPLADDERQLMSPMTMDYLARLSQGKPNQIRLICHSIYNRYMKSEQHDLNITIDVLDDVLDTVAEAFQETELRALVDSIQRLSSVDLEVLYNMTRYPNWSLKDVVDLDESFRGEARSDLAAARRERKLLEKRAHFITLGLMVDDSDQSVLAGGEFLSLYLRFWHEVSKYGKLSRALVLGKGPPTIFGEKSEKLARSLAYVLGESPKIARFIFHPSHREEEGDVIETIRRRFSVLDKLIRGERPKDKDTADLLSECFQVCQMIGKAGLFYILCLSLRNLDSPREVMQVELYFDAKQARTVDLLSLFNLVDQQAHDARVLVEAYDGFPVELTDLTHLLKAIGLPGLEALLDKVDLVGRWTLTSVQHLVQSSESGEEAGSVSEEDKEIAEASKWVGLYAKGDEKGAEQYLTEKLHEVQERRMQARMYNDLGYIRSGRTLRDIPRATKDLETALALHYPALPLTLLNLSYIDIEEDRYGPAIEKIEEALLLTFSRLEIGAEYLRLILPENHLDFRVRWEQHPANALEASYVNLAYALLKSKGYQEAYDALRESLQLIPSSIRLKHALARLYLFRKKADLAKPIYQELSAKTLPDKGIDLEIVRLSRGVRLAKGKQRKRR